MEKDKPLVLNVDALGIINLKYYNMDNWENKNIPLIDTGVKIKFTENVANTSIKDGDVKTIKSYSIWNVKRFICMSFDNAGKKCYDIPYESFNVIK